MVFRILVLFLVYSSLCGECIHADDLSFNTQYTMRLHTATQIVRHRINIDDYGVMVIYVNALVEQSETGSYWNLRLIDNQLRTISEMNVAGEVEQVSSTRLRVPPGNYDLRITAGSNFSPDEFALMVSFEHEADILAEREPNNTPETATALEPNRVMLGNTQSSDDVDLYRLHISEPGFLIIQLDADRFTSGQHWEVALQRGTSAITIVELDPRFNQSAEIKVLEGDYLIYVSSSPTGWSDIDYRLTTRFMVLEDEEPVELTIGEYKSGVFQSETFFSFQPLFGDEDGNTLAMRWYSENDVLAGTIYLSDSGGTVLWEGTLTDSGGYAALLTGLSQQGYLLHVAMDEEFEAIDISYNLGLFYPEQLPIKLEMQVGSPDILVNGMISELDPGFSTTPILLNNRTMLPVRSIIEILGGHISWDEEQQRVSISCNGHRVDLRIGDDLAILDAKEIRIEVSPVIIAGRTMLPLRFISESLGCYVVWIPQGERIIIYN